MCDFVVGMKCIFYYFFFFQAEDGIRDWSVTGVQTCALPILGQEGRHCLRQMARERELVVVLRGGDAHRMRLEHALPEVRDLAGGAVPVAGRPDENAPPFEPVDPRRGRTRPRGPQIGRATA